MVRIGLSVEGSTEVRFIQMLLQPYLEKKNIFITPVSMRGNISIDRIKCSGFDEWLKKLESL